MSLLGQMIPDKSLADAINEYLVDQKIENKTAKTIRFYRQNLADYLKFSIQQGHPKPKPAGQESCRHSSCIHIAQESVETARSSEAIHNSQ
ncbi:MAG TPA: hypothetical protein VMW00_05820 [Dehalococcoidales bacterium]|nr:hypothetical protein [Dehalococcoidales bacterium]